MEFVDLHCHSTYSCLDAFGTPQQMVARAKELGRKAIALTDHGSVSGYVQFTKACKEHEVKPIFGYEAYIVPSIAKMYEEKERHKSHITILASNAEGYQNILKLASLAYQEGFYYSPTIDFEMLAKHRKGLIVLSGCWSGMLQKMLVAKEFKEAAAYVKHMKEIFEDRLYLETQHYELFSETFPYIEKLSSKFSIPIVLTCDSHFQVSEQASIQEVLHAIRDGRPYDETKLFKDAFQWEADALHKLVKKRFGDSDWKTIFANTVEVADRCEVKPTVGAFIKLSPSQEAAKKELVERCKVGVKKRGFTDASDVYRDRFKREIKVISEKEFCDYLLVVADIVNWAKTHQIFVGPGRGSAAGSLICYLLGITEVDPIKHELLFERFIDETRSDLPDIDTDFESDKRELVKQYVVDRFGAERVCDVATFARFKGKNSLDEVGKVFSIPKPAINTVKKFLVERSSADMRGQLTIQDTFEMSPQAKEISQNYPAIMNACTLEGQLRHMSTHAAGVLVGDGKLDEIIAIYQKKGHKISAVEMKDAADLGLVKIDLLGVQELSILKKVMDIVGISVDDMYNLTLDDEETLQGFKEVDVEGIFQFEGESTKSVLRQMTRIDFEMLTACLTLSKPGPSHSGSTTAFLMRMQEKEAKGLDWHPMLDNITKNTYGQIIYQEQIIRILRDFADFSVTDANKCRVVVAKRQGEQEFDKYYPAFVAGTKEKITEEQAKDLWGQIKVFGRYCFNRSHAVSYAFLAYWSMYLKRHYPLQFYLCKLAVEKDENNRTRLLMDAVKKGIKVAPPLLGSSDVHWKIDEDNCLRAGLIEIGGIGEKTAQRLIEEKYTSRKDFTERKAKGITVRALKALDAAHAFPGDKPIEDLFHIHRYDCLDEIAPDRTKIADLRDDSGYVYIAGIFIEMNYKDIFEERQSRGRSTEHIKSPKKSKYAMVLLEDDSDRCLVQIDRFLFFDIGDDVWDAYNNGKFVVVEGEKVPGWQMIRARKVYMYESEDDGEKGKEEETAEEVESE